MERFEEENQNGNWWAEVRANANRLLILAVVALLVISGIAFAYGYHQQSMVRQLTSQASASNAAVNQLQTQVNTLTAKLNEMTAAQASPASTSSNSEQATAPEPETSAKAPEQPAATAPAPASTHAPAKHSSAKRTAAKRSTAADKRYAQLQAQLAEQEKQLKETQEQVAKNRADLEGNINSTRDELNGSIARTHDELVVLEKRGERNYFEFDLSKSKQFQRIGPLSLSLRKADTKHKNFDLAMVVDDNELTKKKVNLYEPIWIHTENELQPVQIVVNKIDKNVVHGYISAPKYKPSELAAANASTVTPVSSKTPAPPANPPNPQPQQPQQ
jgi:uncharacterized coiled-coil protein SlyX